MTRVVGSATVCERQLGGSVEKAHSPACLEQYLIVLAQCYAKDDGRDSLEAMYPLLSLTSLSSNVKHMDRERAHVKPVRQQWSSVQSLAGIGASKRDEKCNAA